MSVTINGTTGIAGVDGSAATPAVQGSDTNTGIFYPAADTVGLSTGGSERMRVDSSGNVGIGTSSPGVRLDVQQNTAADAIISIYNANSGAAYGTNLVLNSANASGSYYNAIVSKTAGTEAWRIDGRGSANTIAFSNGSSSTERMRIDSSGNLLVGATSTLNSAKVSVSAGTTNATTYNTSATQGGSTLTTQQQQTTSVSTVATTILTPSLYGSFCIVFGSDGTNRFIDVVLFSIGTGTLNVISSLNASGAPGARTYSQSSSTLRLAMASGTYTVQVSALSMSG